MVNVMRKWRPMPDTLSDYLRNSDQPPIAIKTHFYSILLLWLVAAGSLLLLSLADRMTL